MSDSSPEYNLDSAALKKFRFLAREGLKALTYEQRREYGAAVERAALSKQRSEFKAISVEPSARCPCASGTWHSEGKDIEAAIKQQQQTALLSFPAKVRRETDSARVATDVR